MPNITAPSRNQLRRVCDGDNDAIRAFERLFRAAGYLLNVTTITANYTITQGDFIILANATSGAITVTTPIVSEMVGRMFFIKKIDASGNAVTFNPNGSETVDGALTLALASQWDSALVANNGSNWFILATA